MTAIPARAAVLREFNAELLVEDVNVLDPRADEVRVRLVATGVCHTDLVVIAGHMPTPVPVVLGHEGAGVVEAVGSAVSTHREGDHVVLSFAYCGHCGACAEGAPSYCHELLPRNFGCGRPDGSTAYAGEAAPRSHFFGQSSFATVAVCKAESAIIVPKTAPLELLGPLGCGVQTGAGAVVNSLAMRSGASIGVFGVGAVGLSAIMAARLAGASRIVAVDLALAKLALAKEFGATDTINASELETAAALRQVAPGGLDYALDTTGNPDVVSIGIQALAVRGVMGLIAGVPGLMGALPIGHLLAGGRQVRGILEGDSVPATFIPKLVEWHRQGRFPLEKMVRFYGLEDINEAIASSSSGEAIKPIIRF
jgi:aryl-alcohol dehydrogenase